MKTSLLYGAMMAIASAVLTLLLFFLGFHSDPAKIKSAQIIAGILGVAIGVTGTVLGTKARRAESPPDQAFTYGNALIAGILIGVVAAFLNSTFQVIYTTVINPGFVDTLIQQQTTQLEERGVPSAQIEKGLGIMRMMLSPGLQFVVGLLGGMFWALIISLITSAFLKRPPQDEVPVVPAPVV